MAVVRPAFAFQMIALGVIGEYVWRGVDAARKCSCTSHTKHSADEFYCHRLPRCPASGSWEQYSRRRCKVLKGLGYTFAKSTPDVAHRRAGARLRHVAAWFRACGLGKGPLASPAASLSPPTRGSKPVGSASQARANNALRNTS